jgi:hypothetical protein
MATIQNKLLGHIIATGWFIRSLLTPLSAAGQLKK